MKIQDDIQEYSVSRNGLNILPLGDLHVGSKHCNMEYIEEAVKTFKKTRGPKRAYLMGDLLEVADKRVGGSVFDSVQKVDEQIETVIKLLKPIRRHIVSIVHGNHERRLHDSFNLQVDRAIAETYNISLYGDQTIDRFLINGRPVTVHSYHGKGSSSYLYTAYSKVVRETMHINADIYLYGHLHLLGVYQRPVVDFQGLKQKIYVLTGHFLNYDGSYADAKMMEYRPESFIILKIEENGRVGFNYHYNSMGDGL